MADLGFALDLSHVQTDGIATWYFKSGDDTGHYSFGELRDAKLTARTLFDLDSYRRQRPFAIQIEASAKVMNTHKTTVLELLGSLGTESMDQIITAQNEQTYKGTLGLTWRFVCEGGMARSRYLEIFADGIIMIDHASYEDWTTLLATPSPGNPDAGDLFYTWSAAAGTGRTPAAFRSVAMEVTGNGETVGSIRNERLVVTGVGSQDGLGMSTVHKLQIELEFEMRQTSAEIDLLESVAGDAGPGYLITLADGALVGFTTQAGFHFEHVLPTDANDIAYIKVVGGGMILPSAWAALIT